MFLARVSIPIHGFVCTIAYLCCSFAEMSYTSQYYIPKEATRKSLKKAVPPSGEGVPANQDVPTNSRMY